MNDKSLFFLTLAMAIVWLILDNIYGHKYLNNFMNHIFSFCDFDVEESTTHESKDGTKHGGGGGSF